MPEFQQAIAPTISTPRAQFQLNNSHSTTIDFDYIYPVYTEEVLPGSTFSMKASVFGRFLTLLNPIMSNTYLDMHFFYAPTRILWDNARKFYGEQIDPGDSIDFTVPSMNATATTGYGEQSIFDYLELPTKIPDYSHNVLNLRMYNFVYNEFYRDQNTQDSLTVHTDNGTDVPGDYALQKRNKRHDYFTSGLVNIVKDPAQAQTLPLGTTAPIYSTGADAANLLVADAQGSATNQVFDHTGTLGDHVKHDTTGIAGAATIHADLTNATAATILQLRQAVQIQAILELDARAGTRYPEQLYAVYGVTYKGESYRPEYLGGGSTRIDITQIPQTSNSGTGQVADLQAYGIFSLNNASFTKSFSEPGYVMAFVSARADITYQQGLSRKQTRTDRFSYFHPLLQGIGDQSTLTQEIYCDDPATDTGSTGIPNNERVFNYQERYAEYKFKANAITGLFRSNATASLDPWHLSEELAANPQYNGTFIEQNTPIDRVTSLTTEPHLKIDCDFQNRAALPMNMYSIPGFGSRL